MIKPHPNFSHWTPDEAAECLNGIDKPLYRKLWKLLGDIKETDRKPLGGDGTSGTVEYPPEPGSYDKGTVAAIWDKLTAEEQVITLNAAMHNETVQSRFSDEEGPKIVE